jgi:hypothetical protein
MSNVPHRPPWVQIAFLVVFGALALTGLYRVIDGSASGLTWLSLILSTVLFVGTAYRVSRSPK